jgi:hypothetical protein
MLIAAAWIAVCVGAADGLDLTKTSGAGSQPTGVARVELIGTATIAGTALDLSGLTDLLPGKVPHNRLGSFGSGMDALGKDDLYIACDDRGPGDGIAKFRCRLQTLRITIDPGAKRPVGLELVKTTLLSGENGRALTGWSGDVATKSASDPLRYDPEAIRVSPRGTYFVSEEYGPSIDEFDSSGAMVRRFKVPERFACMNPSERPEDEMPPKTRAGRQANRGFEGLALLPDGHTLVAALQSPLIQDGGLGPAPKNQRTGVNVRFLSLDTRSGATKEHVYQLEDASHGVNELLALEDGSLLVLERDGNPGESAKFRRVFVARLDGATDVSGIDALPESGLPEGVSAMRKTTLVDFMSPEFKLAGSEMPEKLEALAMGPTLKDGRRTLIVVSDNDMIAERPSVFWVFALGRE